MGFFEKFFGIIVGTISGSYFAIVGDIVTCIAEGLFEERIDPDGIHPQAFYIIKLLDNSLQIAYSITI